MHARGAVIRSIGWLRQGIRSCLSTPKAETLWLELAAIGCFPIMRWIGITAASNHEYRHVKAAAVQSTADLAQAREESTRRTIGQIDTILLSARALRAAQGDRFDFHDWVRIQTLPHKMTVQITMVNREGLITASTMPLPPGLSVADQPHFRAQIDNGAEGREAAPDEVTALVMIDLDGFKGVNDRLGHDAGNALLIEVGRRLRALVRGTDFVARLGGGEFVLLLPGVHQREDILPVAERVLRWLAGPSRIQGQQIGIGASLGIAFHPPNRPDSDPWFEQAQEPLDVLRDRGCTEVQGNLLGRPIPLGQVEDFTRSKIRPLGGQYAHEGKQEKVLFVS